MHAVYDQGNGHFRFLAKTQNFLKARCARLGPWLALLHLRDLYATCLSSCCFAQFLRPPFLSRLNGEPTTTMLSSCCRQQQLSGNTQRGA